MGPSNKYNNYTFDSETNGDINDDPNFDLDEYIRQKSDPHSRPEHDSSGKDDQERSQFKNALLIFMVFAAAFLWVNDWSVSQAWNSVFGNEEVTSTAPSLDVQIPEITIPDIPAPPVPPTSGTTAGFPDYLSSLNEAGYQDDFTNSQMIGLYNGGVSLDYLNELDEAGYLDQFSYAAIIGLYNGNVSIDFLRTMNEAGYMDDFSYSAIIAFANTDVTAEYLDQLNKNGLLEGMSYTDIIMAYNADN